MRMIATHESDLARYDWFVSLWAKHEKDFLHTRKFKITSVIQKVTFASHGTTGISIGRGGPYSRIAFPSIYSRSSYYYLA